MTYLAESLNRRGILKMVFAIIYDIDTTKRNYSPLFEKIKSLGAWMHYIDSAWFVSPSSPRTAQEIFNELEPFIDQKDDYLLVIGLKGDYQGWLPKEAWDWMNKSTF